MLCYLALQSVCMWLTDGCRGCWSSLTMNGVSDSTQQAQGLLKAALVVMQRAALPAAASATLVGDVQARSWLCCAPAGVVCWFRPPLKPEVWKYAFVSIILIEPNSKANSASKLGTW